MALFKLRKKVDEAKPASAPAETIEDMRRRARHRLIGAVVLVLVGVIGFPLLFDTQPRPVAVDIPIEIPDRNKVKPLPPLPTKPAPAVSGKVTPPPAPAAALAAPGTAVAAASAPKAAPAPAPMITETRQEAGLASAPAPAPAVAKAETKPAPAAVKAEAKPAEKAPDTAAAASRFVVQVGAFAEKDKALAAQRKLERAGLKNYTQVADTGDGKRIRVRAGPFASRAEADKAAAKIKGLDLPVRILTL